jgi:hypothetical protein
MTESPDEVVLPALLRAARGAYGNAVRQELTDAGFGDLPRNGAFVISGMANWGGNATDLLDELGKNSRGRERTGRLLDALAETGYVTRGVDASGQPTIEVTDRGRAAATCVRAAVTSVDAELAAAISAEQMAGLRAGLMALWEIRERGQA